MNNRVETVVRKLGYVLKEEQRKVINAFIRGNDVFAVLPTGYGRSLCYFSSLMNFDMMDFHLLL